MRTTDILATAQGRARLRATLEGIQADREALFEATLERIVRRVRSSSVARGLPARPAGDYLARPQDFSDWGLQHELGRADPSSRWAEELLAELSRRGLRRPRPDEGARRALVIECRNLHDAYRRAGGTRAPRSAAELEDLSLEELEAECARVRTIVGLRGLLPRR
jgi:hypothetical protein